MSEEIIDYNSGDDTGLKVTVGVKDSLSTAAKWGTFLSVMGYIGLGFMVLGAFGSFAMGGNGFRGDQAMILGLVYLLMAIVYFFPVYYLNQFASKIKQAVRSGEQMTFEEAMKFLAKQYQFMGILTIVIISIYILVFLFAIATMGGRF